MESADTQSPGIDIYRYRGEWYQKVSRVLYTIWATLIPKSHHTHTQTHTQTHKDTQRHTHLNQENMIFLQALVGGKQSECRAGLSNNSSLTCNSYTLLNSITQCEICYVVKKDIAVNKVGAGLISYSVHIMTDGSLETGGRRWWWGGR